MPWMHSKVNQKHCFLRLSQIICLELIMFHLYIYPCEDKHIQSMKHVGTHSTWLKAHRLGLIRKANRDVSFLKYVQCKIRCPVFQWFKISTPFLKTLLVWYVLLNISKIASPRLLQLYIWCEGQGTMKLLYEPLSSELNWNAGCFFFFFSIVTPATFPELCPCAV